MGRIAFLASCIALALATSFLAGQQDSIGRGDREGPSRQPGGRNVDGPAEQVWSERAGDRRSRMMSRPIILAGKVVTEDGSPIPETIVVELVCHASVRQQVHTFKGGQFSFDLSPHPSAAFLDASVARNDADNVNPFARVPGGEYTAGGDQVDLSGCEVRANLPGFVSDRIQLGQRRALDRPDIGTIVIYYHAVASLNLGRMEAAEASAIKVQESQDSRFLSGSHYIRGAVLARKGDFESAAKQFRHFLKIAPQGRGATRIKENLVAWERQGLIRADKTSPAQAGQTFQ